MSVEQLDFGMVEVAEPLAVAPVGVAAAKQDLERCDSDCESHSQCAGFHRRHCLGVTNQYLGVVACLRLN